MKYFGSIEAIRQADVSELEKAPSMNRRAADAVYSFFHANGG
jgi:excinuclease ABC subunit C